MLVDTRGHKFATVVQVHQVGTDTHTLFGVLYYAMTLNALKRQFRVLQQLIQDPVMNFVAVSISVAVDLKIRPLPADAAANRKTPFDHVFDLLIGTFWVGELRLPRVAVFISNIVPFATTIKKMGTREPLFDRLDGKTGHKVLVLRHGANALREFNTGEGFRFGIRHGNNY